MEFFGIKKERKSGGKIYNKKEKMLLKLKKIKKNAWKIYRNRKKTNVNSRSSFQYMMQTGPGPMNHQYTV